MNEQPAAGGTVLSVRTDPVVEPKWYLKISEAWHTMSQHLGLKRLQELIQGTCSLTDEPVWLLGVWYGLANKDTNTAFMPEEVHHALLQDFCSKFWFTYRRDFPPIGPSTLTSDVGWGCTLRSGQMMMAEAMVRCWWGRSTASIGWHSRHCTNSSSKSNLSDSILAVNTVCAGHLPDAGEGNQAAAAALETAAVLPADAAASPQQDQLQLLQLFLDVASPASPFSIHNLCRAGALHGVVAGHWVGPWMLCKTLAAAAEQAQQQLGQSLGLHVHVVCDPGGGAPQLQPDSLKNLLLQVDTTPGPAPNSSAAGQAAALDAQGQPVVHQQQRGLLLLIPLTLGVGKVNQRYLPQLCQVLTFPQSVGIVGGRPGASLFFMGVQGDSSVLYLDPHEAQEAPALPHDVATFHCNCPRLMPLSAIDPSLAIGFYCGNTDELDNLTKRLQQLADSSGGAPLMTVELEGAKKQQQQPVVSSTDLTPEGQGTADDWELV